MSNLREEVVQTTAVGVAILEDLHTGNGATGGESTEHVLEDVIYERIKQNRKWGPQHHDPFTWLMILMEEVGEIAEEIDPPKNKQYPFSHSTHEQIIHAGQRAKAYLEAGI